MDLVIIKDKGKEVKGNMKYRTAKIEMTVPATDNRGKDWQRLQKQLTAEDEKYKPGQGLKLYPQVISLTHKTYED